MRLGGTVLAAVAMWLAGMVAPALAAPASDLSVLTYNVEGLPFPLAWNRGGAARTMADRLKVLRAAGEQPHVVVLQEAFGEAQRAIGRSAGYRYVAFGPDADTAPAAAIMTDADRDFSARASIFKGERSGKWAGSGLAILSDYPIVAVRRAAFPAFACAGYDCLANKGVMMAMVRVPGSARPVAVIASHLNSKDASGVDKARWNYAFRRQVDTIGAFLKTDLPADTPYVFAGDTNIGRSMPRRAQFVAMLATLPRAVSGVVSTALATCLEPGAGCALSQPADARKSLARNKDWQVYAAGLDTILRPIAIRVPFGRDAAGQMLSDHIGYMALYQLSAAAPKAAALIALR